ncbi:Maleylpyruvate isomerase [Achromobacter deleyi]|uniref:Maleylpyruvate isomerase n=1 Tax=Achromobacter deleyi TaxID=1353891 RepID=A0A6S7A011_9BURK|nr:maleylacetoacetate isomerase [Achromobacter deleyi]CAB3669652.1 Maleylpyruvate isomerase [Achromobacter deleyi]CAB3844114.1 Maleylpyruvate isomerase [Achromobacter deleyi]CAB3849476.1 Maleylpyruvate isomerase [Achromobacter deleyi]
MADTPLPTLHSYWRSSAAYRVRLALAIKRLPYRQVAWHMAKGEHQQPAYRQIAPFGLVPMLEIDGLRLQQSLAIIEYLDARHPEPALLPDDPAQRAQARALAQLVACEMHPLNNLRTLNRLRGQFGADDAQVQDWYRHWCEEGFRAFEAALGASHGDYALGAAPSLVECCLVPQVYNARRYEVDLTPFARVRAIVQACESLPAFDAARPENQPDAPRPAQAA